MSESALFIDLITRRCCPNGTCRAVDMKLIIQRLTVRVDIFRKSTLCCLGEILAPFYNSPSTSPRQISTKAGCTHLWNAKSKTWAAWEKITGFSTVSFNKSNIRKQSIIHSYLTKETASFSKRMFKVSSPNS